MKSFPRTEEARWNGREGSPEGTFPAPIPKPSCPRFSTHCLGPRLQAGTTQWQGDRMERGLMPQDGADVRRSEETLSSALPRLEEPRSRLNPQDGSCSL